MAATKCTSWRGHKFEPRYSTRPKNLLPKQIDELFWLSIYDRQRLTQPSKTYECDVCVRCGHVVQQPQKADVNTANKSENQVA